jgi:hypothetical protein
LLPLFLFDIQQIRKLLPMKKEDLLARAEKMNGPVADQVKELLDLFLSDPGHAVSKRAEELLLGMRSGDFAPAMMQHLSNPEFLASRPQLLRICWENGSDFSGFSHAFIDLVKYGTWEEAIEAFSVLEGLRPDGFLPEKKELDLNRILDGFDKLELQRKEFAGRLIELYENEEESN